jgi:uncharacterized protein involved in type VI secretion and phage assembly
MSLEKVVANLINKIERHFYGKYRGIVIDNKDPEQLGRLKVKVPSVLGDNVVTGWSLPCVPYGGDADQGFLFIPEVGAGVWVEFEEGDLEFPIWVGTFWSKPGGNSELPKPNKPDGSEESSVQDPPTRKIIKTKAGHTIQLEDDAGNEMVTIVEGKNGNVMTMNKDGIKVTDGANKHQIVMDNAGITISDGVSSGNKVIMEQSGLTVQDKNGNKITMDASSGFPTGPGMTLNGGTRICLEGLISWLLKHQHVGNMGAPTPLFPADMSELMIKQNTPQGGLLSDTVKAK